MKQKREAKAGVAQRDDRVWERDAEGRPLYADDLVSFVEGELERRREERRPLEMQWALNTNFYAGHQNCDIHAENGEIETFSPQHAYEEAGVFNRIAPLIETRLSALRGLSYRMIVRPRTNEMEDSEKSEVATRLLRTLQETPDFAAQKDTWLLWSELCGSAFILSYWDKDGGAIYGTAQDHPVHEGDVGYCLLSPYEVFPESLYCQRVEDQESILIEQIQPVERIFETYGVRVEGADTPAYGLAPVTGGQVYGTPRAAFSYTGHTVPHSAPVLTWLEKPHGRYPRGRMMIVAGGLLVYYGDLPYDRIPLVILRSKEMGGQFFGRSVIADLIPLQRAYNGVKNKIHDYIRAVASNPLLVPEGSIVDIAAFAARGLPPGEVVEYAPEHGRPEPLSPAPLPTALHRECTQLESDMEYTAGVSQLMVMGNTPSGVTSGTAIESLRAIDNTRLSLSGENLREAIRCLSVLWLQIYKRYMTGYRVLRAVGQNDAGGVMAFCGEDINSYDVCCDTENELLVSPEMQKQNLLSAIQMGLLSDEQGKLPRAVRSRVLRMMQLGDYSDLLGEEELHTQAAERENAALMEGKNIQVGLFDDHALHIAAHKRWLLQGRFAYLREKHPQIAAMLERHIFAHILRQRGKEEKGHGNGTVL